MPNAGTGYGQSFWGSKTDDVRVDFHKVVHPPVHSPTLETILRDGLGATASERRALGGYEQFFPNSEQFLKPVAIARAT